MMHNFKAMSYLLWMRFRGNLRKRTTELASLRGAFSLITIIVFISMLAYFSGSQIERPTLNMLTSLQYDVPALLSWGIFFAIVSTVVVGTGPPIYHSQSEINLLWSAPLSRGWLVYYKLCGYCAGAAMTSLLLVILIPGSFTTRSVRFVTLFLTMVFVQFGSTLIKMVLAYLRMHIPFQFLKLNWYGVACTILLLLVLTLTLMDFTVKLIVLILQLPLIHFLSAPFTTVAELLVSDQTGAAFTRNCLLVTGMIGLMIILIIKLDQSLDQHMLEASSRANHLWSKALRSGNLMRSRTTHERLSGQPPFRLWGLGPLIWSQWLYAIRSSGHVLLTLLIAAPLTGFFLASVSDAIPTTYLVSGAFFISIYFLPKVLVFDFRSAPENLEFLRGLPAPAVVVCLSQIIVPVAIKTAIELSAVTSMAFAIPALTLKHWAAIVYFLSISNFVIVALDNIYFLKNPGRLLPVGRMDFDFLGRTLLEFLLKSLFLVFTYSMAVLTTLWIVRQSGHGLGLFITLLSAIALLICFGVLTVLSRVFDRVDVTEFDRL